MYYRREVSESLLSAQGSACAHNTPGVFRVTHAMAAAPVSSRVDLAQLQWHVHSQARRESVGCTAYYLTSRQHQR